MKISVRILAIALVVLIASMSFTTYSASKAYASRNGSIRLHEVGKPPNIILDASFNPLTVFNPASPVGGVPFCSSGSLGTILCYPPSFLKKAYDFPTNPAINGAGQTIVIVDAFGSPTIASDLKDFDGNFSIPAPPSFKILCGPTWTGVVSDHCPTPLPTDLNFGDELGWAEEITLDVTEAHALAPGANIVLVVANSDYDYDLNAAEMAVVSQPSLAGSIMSQSFGEPDDLVGCNYLPCNTTTPGVFDPTIRATYDNIATIAKTNMWTVLASSGDDGANEAYSMFGTGELTPSYPSTNPNVLAIGGTQGFPYGGVYGPAPGPGGTFTCSAISGCNTGLLVINGGANGCTTAARPGVPTSCVPFGYGGEGAWQEVPILYGSRASSGGGISNNYYGIDGLGYAPPSYQAGLPSSFALTNGTMVSRTGRVTPDVALNSAVYGGVLAYMGPASTLGRWLVFGGTSASSPEWAAIMALVNQVHGSPVGFINPAIYQLASGSLYSDAFHDITVGNNTNVPGTTQNGYVAGAGYDPTTGWGTPDVAHFLADIQSYITGAPSAYAVRLVQGWNLFSLPLTPPNTAIKTVLNTLIAANEFASIWSYQKGKWVFATLSKGTLAGPLTTVQDGYGYWIYMTQPDTLYVNGYVVPPATPPSGYSLTLGWNLIGFKPIPTVGPEPVNNLPSTGGYLNTINAKYDPNIVLIYDNVNQAWIRGTSTTDIQPGQGLWVFMTSPATLYP